MKYFVKGGLALRKNEYLSSRAVNDFISWVETILDVPQSFTHTYYHRKYRREYEFENLFSAYEKYDWEWDYTIEELSNILMKSILESDEKSCEDTCHMILEWGGVKNKGNKKRIAELRPNICAYLRVVQKRLAMDLPSHKYYSSEIHMTSGFSKIYSACVDEYMIYDSRVGAALGLLIRTFCIHNHLPNIPCELKFVWTNGRGEQVRNPNCDRYEFPKLRLYKEDEYFENNIRANWLISAIANRTKSKFSNLESHSRLRALEQALFMIGYDIRA